MPKAKWDGAEELTINNFYNILNMLLKVRIDRSQPQYFISTSISYQPKYFIIKT